MDIKIAGITEAIMQTALSQARDGRLHILEEMAKGISGARDELRETVPRISVIQIRQDKIGAVIGPGGKVIREICETTGAKIDIDDDGTVKVASADAAASQQAIDWIRGLTSEPEIGVVYTGKVVRVVDFGAFVNFLGAQDGLCHISELKNERVAKVTDVINEGDTVKVKVLNIDDRGKVKLTMRGIDQVTGEESEVPPRPPREDRHERSDQGERPPRRDRGPRRQHRAS
jgi:polyribonucleotide nucleotidyltransferase